MRRDRGMLVAAVLLLLLPLLLWLWSSSGARRVRETTLAGVPAFPAPGQAPARRRTFVPRAPTPTPATAQPAPEPRPAAPLSGDRLNAFALAPSPSVGVVQVNALFNTPLFDRLKRCMPEELARLEQHAAQYGIDLQRDVDRVAMVPGGAAVSGFFEGKKVAEQLIPGGRSREYRGQSLFDDGRRCAAQLGNLVVVGASAQCEGLVDRALAPAPGKEPEAELYGELFLKTDLAALRVPGALGASGAEADALQKLLEGLSGLTVRANVWDSVALSVEGEPRPGSDPRNLSAMARGAVSLFKSQLDDDQVALQTLADLAQVSTKTGRLELNLALPAKDLLERLHFPCPGLDGGT